MSANPQPSTSDLETAYNYVLEDLALAALQADAHLELARRLRERLERRARRETAATERNDNHRRTVSALNRVRSLEVALRAQRDAVEANFDFYRQRRDAHLQSIRHE